MVDRGTDGGQGRAPPAPAWPVDSTAEGASAAPKANGATCPTQDMGIGGPGPGGDQMGGSRKGAVSSSTACARHGTGGLRSTCIGDLYSTALVREVALGRDHLANGASLHNAPSVFHRREIPGAV